MDPNRPAIRKPDPGPDETLAESGRRQVAQEPTLAGEPAGVGPAAASPSPDSTLAGSEMGQTVGGPTPSASQRRPPPTVDGYEILGELGRGGMGVVYLARRVLLNRPCALKMILSGVHAAPEAAVRFLAEAEAVARLRHPNVVQIHHIGEAGGLPYFELEYCAGGSLDRALDGTPRPAKAAAELVEGLARGVAEAHREGLVHRDLKPANVLIGDDGTPKVTDFGLVRTLGIDRGLTRTDTLLGSPSYMAPEQAQGLAHEAGPQADVYSLGAILYELLAGRPPFRGATMLDTLEQARSADPVAPSRLVPGTPRDLETICLKCLEKTPERRYADASGLADDLRRFLGGDTIQARPSPPWERTAKWARRRPALAAMIGAVQLLLVALLLTGVWSYAQIREALDAAESARGKAVESARHEAEARAAAEKAGAQEAAARSEAESSRNAALAETAHALLSETRALRLSREPGWSVEAIANLRRLAAPGAPGRDVGRLRDEAVACLAGLDVRERARLTAAGSNVLLHGTCYSPDGTLLASYEFNADRVLIWDAGRGIVVKAIPAAANGPAALIGFGFRPDGSCLAYATQDGRVAYQALPGRAGAPLPPRIEGGADAEGNAIARALAFDADGRRVAVSWGGFGAGPRIAVYDVATGKPIRGAIDAPHDWAPYQVPLALSPDGRRLAFAGQGHLVRIVEADGDRPPVTLGGHRAEIYDLAFDPSGSRLASGSHDETVRIWDLTAPGREPLTLYGNRSTVNAVAFSPDGQLVASAGSDGSIRLWDPRTGDTRMDLSPAAGKLSDVAFRPDGRGLAVSANEAVVTYDLSGSRERRDLIGHSTVAIAAAFHPRRHELFTVGEDYRLLAWDAEAGLPRTIAATPDRLFPTCMAISPDGSRIAIGLIDRYSQRLPHDRAIQLVDLDRPGAPSRLLVGHPGEIDALAFDAEGRRLASGDTAGAAILWDVASGRETSRRQEGSAVFATAFLADGRLFGAIRPDQVAVRDPAGVAPERRARFVNGVRRIAVAPGGGRMVAGLADGTLRAVALPDFTPISLAEPAHRGGITALAISPDGLLLASAGEDLRVVLRDARTLRPLASLAGPSIPVTRLAFSGDARYLALVNQRASNVVTLWDLALVRSGLDDLGLDWEPRMSAPSIADDRKPHPPPPEDDAALARRIDALKDEGRHAEAADAVDLWIDRHPEDHNAWVDAASLRARAADRVAYDRHRRRMLAEFGATDNPTIAERTAKACLLLPGDAESIREAVRLADLSISASEESSGYRKYYLFAQGLARYRMARFAEAEATLARSLTGMESVWNLSPPAHFVRSMALARLGRLSEARESFTLGSEFQRRMPAPQLSFATDRGFDQRNCETLRREAEALILYDPIFPATPFAK